jgi:predicted membrane protein
MKLGTGLPSSLLLIFPGFSKRFFHEPSTLMSSKATASLLFFPLFSLSYCVIILDLVFFFFSVVIIFLGYKLIVEKKLSRPRLLKS